LEPKIEEENDNVNDEEAIQDNTETREDYIPETQSSGQQYFVNAQSGSDHPSSESSSSDVEVIDSPASRNLFPLPQVQQPQYKQAFHGKSLIDYLKSVIMTSEDYIAATMAKAIRKEVVAKERGEWKIQAQQQKAQREEEKKRHKAEKLLHQIQAEHKKADHELEKVRKVAEQAQKTIDANKRRHGCGNELEIT